MVYVGLLTVATAHMAKLRATFFALAGGPPPQTLGKFVFRPLIRKHVRTTMPPSQARMRRTIQPRMVSRPTLSASMYNIAWRHLAYNYFGHGNSLR